MHLRKNRFKGYVNVVWVLREWTCGLQVFAFVFYSFICGWLSKNFVLMVSDCNIGMLPARQLFCLLPWSLYYSHNHLPCFDTLLSFKIVVVVLVDLCLPFVLQLFRRNILLPCFLIFLFCSSSFSVLLYFQFAAHRRNEPLSRPHSWHATKFNESHSEAKTQSTPSAGWQTRYDAR